MNTLASAPDPWIVRPRPYPEASLRLMCFPFAGAGAANFGLWSQKLPKEIELVAIQLPGRENRLREPPFTRFSEAVDSLATALRPCLDRPFAVFGHSLGALLGFEWARAVRRRWGIEPAILFVSGRQAPHLKDTTPAFHTWPEPEFVDYLQKRYQGLPQSILESAELRRLFLPTLRADFELLSSYRFTIDNPLSCPVTALGGLDDDVPREALSAWKDHSTGAFQVHVLPGSHFFIQTSRPRLLQIVSEELQSVLSR